ncbi:DUF2797 domain-containing protein [Halorussus limi]|uniref:DUF2797 domain-containing protein n=3 Tax=Haladaptataceae TaxID=3064797 RepID=A0A8U0IQN8_9EURY|nr:MULTISPECIES: DUF2797 domain-containing protein [Halorussus]UPV73941.1 DUF2797 domain-containing protein [Halorussus limi]UPW02339.1 DUF2797 domain-containing protein [Halorussus gelatinilyticus]
MVSWSRGKPRLYLADTDGPIDLAGLVGEEICVDIQPGFRCQHCGDQADTSPCQECQSKPPHQQCIFTPGTSCTYQDCPFPSFKRRSCAHNFVVYLVAKDCVKAGITQADRYVSRWAEQGATHGMVVARTPNRRVAGIIEEALDDVVSTESTKEWYEPLDDPKQELVTAANSCREVLTGSLEPFSVLPDDEDGFDDRIITVPVHFSGDDATVLNLPEVTVGDELQSEVLGVRGQILATKDAVVNFDHLKGEQLTVEAPAECIPAMEDAQ